MTLSGVGAWMQSFWNTESSDGSNADPLSALSGLGSLVRAKAAASGSSLTREDILNILKQQQADQSLLYTRGNRQSAAQRTLAQIDATLAAQAQAIAAGEKSGGLTEEELKELDAAQDEMQKLRDSLSASSRIASRDLSNLKRMLRDAGRRLNALSRNGDSYDQGELLGRAIDKAETDGLLTTNEAADLKTQLDELLAAKAKADADGRITAGEQAGLERLGKALSKKYQSLTGSSDPDKAFKRQEAGIAAGVKDGSLTETEAKALRAEQERIQKYMDRFKSDGTLTKQEKQSLISMQTRAASLLAQLRDNGLKA